MAKILPFNPDDHRPPEYSNIDPYTALLAELQGYGFDIGHVQETDDKPVRCKRDKSKDKPGWYHFKTFQTNSGQTLGFATYGDWRDDSTIQWDSKADLTPHERTTIDLERARQRELDKAQQVANRTSQANMAAAKMLHLKDAEQHPYLTAKKVKAYGLKLDGLNLVVPMADSTGAIKAYQTISNAGEKRYLAGAQKNGLYHLIGQPGQVAYIAEGYATAATIHEITGQAVVVAFDTSGLKPALNEFRKVFAGRVIFAADNDANQTGEKHARAAVDNTSTVIMPDFNGRDGTDFNDLFNLDPDAAKAQLRPEDQPEPLIRITKTTAFKEPKPLDFTIDDFLIEGTTSMIYGPPGVCKSFIAQDMGMCVATGKPWAGVYDTYQGAVLYVAGEGHEDLSQRIQAWKIKNRLKDTDEPPFYHTEHEVNIRDPLLCQELVRVARGLPEKVGFTIIDTLSTNFGGGDENGGDMAEFVNHCNGLARELRCHVAIIHHAGKDTSKGARGSSSNHGNVYTYMEVAEKDGHTVLICHKQKGGERPAPIIFDTELIHVGEAEDRRGKLKNITSLVMNVNSDPNAGRKLAEALAEGKRPKPLGQRQQKIKAALDILAQSGRTFSRQTFVNQVKLQGVNETKTSDAVQEMINKGWVTTKDSQLFEIVGDLTQVVDYKE